MHDVFLFDLYIHKHVSQDCCIRELSAKNKSSHEVLRNNTELTLFLSLNQSVNMTEVLWIGV